MKYSFSLYNLDLPKSYGLLTHQTFINDLIPNHILVNNFAVFFRMLTLTCSSTQSLPTTSLEILIALDLLYQSPCYALFVISSLLICLPH